MPTPLAASLRLLVALFAISLLPATCRLRPGFARGCSRNGKLRDDSRATQRRLRLPSWLDRIRRCNGRSSGLMQQFENKSNDVAGWLVKVIATVLFYDISKPFVDEGQELGLAAVVAYLVLAATFFTLLTGFLNVRGSSTRSS